jgi:hypothetical protein
VSVPEPSSLWLLGGALAAILAIGRVRVPFPAATRLATERDVLDSVATPFAPSVRTAGAHPQPTRDGSAHLSSLKLSGRRWSEHAGRFFALSDTVNFSPAQRSSVAGETQIERSAA